VARFKVDRERGFNPMNDRLHRAVYRFNWTPSLARRRRRGG
jgi:hypothetical protein